MRETIQSFGWYVRRAADPDSVTAFYRDTVGLPALRSGPMVTMFWLGEIFTFECLPGGSARPAFADSAEAPMMPVFRSHDAGRLIERLKAAGVRFLRDTALADGSRVAHFFDPSGSVTGIQQRPAESSRVADQQALRRWKAGPARLPGAGPLPAGIQSLGWVIMRVADVARELAFYRDVIGLDVVSDEGGTAALSLGETATLNLFPGGTLAAIPTDRSGVDDSFILRVWDVDGLVADLKSRGVHFVNDPFDIPGGRLAYFADPEGRVIGLQQRTPASDRVEDHEAARRWASR
ncbi:MAG: VOC family protein [Dehalococcoidia bacterium]